MFGGGGCFAEDESIEAGESGGVVLGDYFFVSLPAKMVPPPRSHQPSLTEEAEGTITFLLQKKLTFLAARVHTISYESVVFGF